MVEGFAQLGIAMPERLHAIAARHLLRRDGQEDLCFGVWTPSCGASRFAALIRELILPLDGERSVHGNVAFMPAFYARALQRAAESHAGLVVMHSHIGPGWQALSRDDFRWCKEIGV